ncbi:iron chelate uptake ABC transporter family permease subunit [Nocardioides sp. MAH-18]|uniref:Iron chelate uptake ABC transporter family permease subunit n=1 Tax=Nocardioides agri TaxID=2682843 RepID=A0A6L6XND2_9ACTN|nr:iron chelate uptake ABC transporter family permease subunit [Nocardioides sp. CGMCC 1.13656]MBA2953882.1 iron chelate uptake ABC transporter family permease subunit [Nocardioides sp. CGMCC 1.13656]MVQ48744.1 iron chelate uptake ABC transporter family permease subunit [Nocardioides sp. MAH-18]
MTTVLDRPDAVARVVHGRRRRRVRRTAVVAVLAVLVVAVYALSLMVGNTFYGPGEVWDVVRGETVPGASFTVGELRLPRATLALLTGAAFGLGGVTFQTMLRNPLASPDIIGISSGASAAAVIGIVVYELGATAVSFVAIPAALGTTLLIYVLAYKDGIAGTRLILIGIGVDVMLRSVIAYVLMRAAVWDIQAAMRWLTGNLNNASWESVRPLAVAMVLAVPVLLTQARSLSLLQQGDDSATALGVRVERTRLVAILAAVVLIAFATAAAGPIAFVAFLAGPIAARVVGGGTSLMVPAALVGALLVLSADLVGQFAFENRYPVGVITGALGAPFLLYLLIRTNRAGGSL